MLLEGRGIGAGADLSRRPPPGIRTSEQVTVSGRTRSAMVLVEQHDTYFFDHQLDHLPGMALVCGVLDLFRCGDLDYLVDPAAMLRVSLRFPTFCDLAPVQIEAVATATAPAAGPGPAEARFAIGARQHAALVADGEVGFRVAAPVVPSGTPPEASTMAYLLPADLALVHRHRPENVMISEPVAGTGTSTVAVRRPPAGHLLASPPGQPMRAEVLVDAVRQFGTLLNHTEFGRPPDVVFVLLGIELEVPCGLTAEVFLRWTRRPAPRGRDRMVVEVVSGAPDGAACGAVEIDYFAAAPAIYQRLRGRGRLG